VLVENGGFGAQSAAPIARQVLDYYLLGKVPAGIKPEDPCRDRRRLPRPPNDPDVLGFVRKWLRFLLSILRRLSILMLLILGAPTYSAVIMVSASPERISRTLAINTTVSLPGHVAGRRSHAAPSACMSIALPLYALGVSYC
jgi:hypothetical protein